ncbi:SemiSWEET family sugar transporter [Bradyrhizobium liaoningense]|uniref:SemiSWEET family sugar transporter n=1 Tax=Bradyrhizobium liaoningense TaxID=43992 RepID=UPI0020126058|nr:hypothetical protein [Bradyrhizobium liaoningense]
MKAWPRGSTGDLSLGMLSALTLGLGLWIIYGAIEGDWVIVLANVAGATAVRRGPRLQSAGYAGLGADLPQDVGPRNSSLVPAIA